jgi:hypothetical protein
LYRTTSSFTYTGTTYTLTGITNTALQINKIFLDGDYLDIVTIAGAVAPIDVIRYIMPGITAPTIDNGSAGSISANQATITGTVNAGNATIVTVGVQWGTVTGVYGTTVDGTLNGTNYTASLSDLPNHTTIYYRTFVTTAEGTVYGVEQTFTGATMIGSFPLMSVLLQICPVLIFLALIFGLVFFSVRQSKKPSALNLVSVVFFALTLLVALTMFSQIIILFYNILTT